MQHDKDENGASASTDTNHRDDQSDMDLKMYLRFAGMILTGMFVMYWVMFVGSWEWSHIRYSQSRVYMALVMGGTMGLIMLGWMLNMYRSIKANMVVIAVSVVLIALGVSLDRTQATVSDVEFMKGMIPHHSLAITRSERFNSSDARVCELAVEISEAQRREILEMNWLIDDIDANGAASTIAEARERPVPEYDVAADRDCSSG